MSRFTLGICLEVTVNMKLIFTILTSEAFALGYRECLLQHQYILCFISELQCPSSALPVLKLLGHHVNVFQYTWQNKVRGMYFLVRKLSLWVLQQKNEYKISMPEQEVSGKLPTNRGKDLGSSCVSFAMFLEHHEMLLSCPVWELVYET